MKRKLLLSIFFVAGSLLSAQNQEISLTSIRFGLTIL